MEKDYLKNPPDHDELRRLLIQHVEDDDRSHQVLLDAFNAHISQENPDDADHRIISTRLASHIELVDDSHQRLLAAFERHVAREKE
ncbi:TPA: hypothetical protein I7243_22435 [Vibrio vulnificus]|nr:hypothetical protein [Vibrio vulnificus]